MELRYYQREAIDAAYKYLSNSTGNPVIVMPTGSGKTPVIATLCSDIVTQWGGRVAVLAHVKELLEQSHATLSAVCPGVDVGLYSAGLKSRDTDHSVICAGIQSVYSKADQLGAFSVVLVDEAHLIPTEGDGMYRQFLADALLINPSLRVIGLTATPYRLKSGYVCGPDHFLNDVCYEIGVKELISDGYLCPLVSKGTKAKADMSAVRITGGEYNAGESEAAWSDDQLVRDACLELVGRTGDRRSVIAFCSGVGHAHLVAGELRSLTGQTVGVITGETADGERASLLKAFKDGSLRWLVNVGVLTTGFDAPNIDCVCLLRSTLSPGLYYQMVGRGLRMATTKHDCLVLDFGDNILTHGPIDAIKVKNNNVSTGEAPAKECPECQELIAAGCMTCPVCGYEFPPPDTPKHTQHPSDAGILTGQYTDTVYEVDRVWYAAHTKRNAEPGAPRTLRCDYSIGLQARPISEWHCVEHQGYPRTKAAAWWRERVDCDCPDDAEAAAEFANLGTLREPLRITVRETAGEKFPRIINYDLSAECPQSSGEMVAAGGMDEDDVPF